MFYQNLLWMKSHFLTLPSSKYFGLSDFGVSLNVEETIRSPRVQVASLV